MFPFINCPNCNPLGGRCPYQCVYCWATGKDWGLIDKFKMAKYHGEPRLFTAELARVFKKNDFAFLCDMTDWLAFNVPDSMVRDIFQVPHQNPQATFLSSTKNPKRYFDFLDLITPNLVLGVTIESNQNYPKLSIAPSQFDRLYWISTLSETARLRGWKLFISIEPILDFDLDTFETDIYRIKPWAVAVGYDNYPDKHPHLPEPPLEKTMQLIEHLEKSTTVYRKTLREPLE